MNTTILLSCAHCWKISCSI